MRLPLFSLLLLLCVQCAHAWWWDVKTVEHLDVHKYMGRWYEVYGSFIQKSTFQKDSFCCSADYKLREDGKIGVFNARHVHSPDGRKSNTTGYAFVADPKVPGKLKVVFPRAPVGDYWIMKLGPQDSDGLYSYAVVTSKLKSLLWVLARNVEDYIQTYDTDVQKYLKENGFTWFWNRPIKTYQGKDCVYPDH